jgi:hypothetical protein
MKRIHLCLLAAVLSVVFVACRGGGGDADECIVCPFSGGAVRCYLTAFSYQDVCAVDQTIAAITCAEAGGDGVPLPVCAEQPSETGGPGNAPWDPGSSVYYDRGSGEYVIDQIAFEDLKLDPSPLLGESSHLRELESGYYVVARVGDLADALGWQTGDILLSVDGYRLRGLGEFAAAYTSLAEETQFELTVEREQARVVLRYRIQ